MSESRSYFRDLLREQGATLKSGETGFLRKLLNRVSNLSPSPQHTGRASSERANSVGRPRWGLDDVLLEWDALGDSNGDYRIPWTTRDAVEGVHVFGGTGAGKTSTTGTAIPRLGFLPAGWGGLVLCAVPEEAARWQEMAAKSGRSQDVIIFSTESGHGFNFLDYELNAPGRSAGQVENGVAILMQITEVRERGRAKVDEWSRAMRQVLRNGISLLRLADEAVKPAALYKLAIDPDFCAAALEKAEERALADGIITDVERRDLAAVNDFWGSEWRKMPSETKSGIIMTLSGVLDLLQHGDTRELLARETTVTPDMAMEGKIIIIDVPYMSYREVAKVVGAVWKYAFQRAVQRRVIGPDSRPVFLYVDEYQYYITSTDHEFQQTARGRLCSTVYLTQNYPNYEAELGSDSKAVVESLLGNLLTKIWHQNDDSRTNQQAADIISKGWHERTSANTSFSLGSSTMGSQGHNAYQEKDYLVPPEQFRNLLRGGPDNRFVVTAVMYQRGRGFVRGLPYANLVFNQKILQK